MAKSNKRDFAEHDLSRRERQIMSAVYRLGEATIAQIGEHIPDPPTNDAIRRLCHILKEKGFLRAHLDGTRNVFVPTVGVGNARRSALDNIIDTFYGGSAPMLVASLLDSGREDLGPEELARLAAIIENAATKERGE